MFNFGKANDSQKMAISATEGPVLITAGPGTGKTFTLVQRAIYLIQECNVQPEQILIATFTDKAAKELITRITNELDLHNLPVNINDMYIGTFHSLCLRIIKDHLEYSRLKRNYRLLDEFDQKYFVLQNIHKFRDIEGFDSQFNERPGWWGADEICDYVNKLSEEAVDANRLMEDKNQDIAVLGRVLDVYRSLLKEDNLIDFAGIQTECCRLLKENPDILGEIQKQIKYLMIDEYQDTNFIQEQLVFMLGKKHNNICVVGDDDQGLYRFRGATIRNILEFPDKFDGKCNVISLTTNYRSARGIVNFYNEWMETTSGRDFKFHWGKYRYAKRIEANEKETIKSPTVVKLASKDDEAEWRESILNFINKLRKSGKLKNYNQLAFLFNSVKHPRVIALAEFLEQHGIKVYSPRSNMFFERDEVMAAIGCLMWLFPEYIESLSKTENKQSRFMKYYDACVKKARGYITDPENGDLKKFVNKCARTHYSLKGTTDYAYSGLIYQLFRYKPFRDILSADISQGVVDIRPTRNLAILTRIIGKYEYLHRIDVLDGKISKGKRKIDRDTEKLFNKYIRLLFDEGTTEYEDDAEYAPSGCVSFMTIHQSKGMEFPIVFVDSLGNTPRAAYNELIKEAEKYFHRKEFEPYDQMKFFDFWRLFYTAFSRAQNLLVLTCDENNRTPSKYFLNLYDELPSVDSLGFDLSEFDFKEVKKVDLKDTFSFTSHISVYENCALQYKFYKELEFLPVRQGAMAFGTLVHETIEDIHRAVLRGEKNKVTKENIGQWFDNNYSSLVKSEHVYLAEPQRAAALEQVLRYAKREAGRWHDIKQAEVDVTFVQSDYIIRGKIDLIKGADDTVEIVDFKSERKPDMESERVEHYRRQLQLYAYLVEQRTGHKVSKMHIYYTAEKDDSNPRISFSNTKSAIEGTVAAFDDAVHRILRKEFTSSTDNLKTCANCDFRFYCNKA